MPILKKGSKQAKDYMAKIRAMKGTTKKSTSKKMPVFNPYMPDVDYSKRIKTLTKKSIKNKKNMGDIYYYGDGKMVSYTRLIEGEFYEWIIGAEYQEVQYIGRKLRNKDLPISSKFGTGGYIFQFDDGRYTDLSATAVSEYLRTIPKTSVNGYTKGSASFIEKGEKPLKNKTNYRIIRNQTSLLNKGGTFKKFSKINGNTPSKETRHKDTNSHNVNIKVVSGMPIFEYKVSQGGKYYVTSNIPMKAIGIKQVGDGSDHKRGLKTYLFTDTALKKMIKFLGKENVKYIESDF